jgi:hypothetical protein
VIDTCACVGGSFDSVLKRGPDYICVLILLYMCPHATIYFDSVLKRGPEFNGFTKSDSIHLPFTRGFFKLIGAMHCFNPKALLPLSVSSCC